MSERIAESSSTDPNPDAPPEGAVVPPMPVHYIPEPILLDLPAVPGTGGSPYTISWHAEHGGAPHNDLQLIQKVTFWLDPERRTVSGLQCNYFDGTASRPVGGQTGTARTITLALGEQLQTMTAWSTSVAGHTVVAGLRLTTDKQDTGVIGYETGSPYLWSQATGLLVGFAGNAGAGLDSIAPLVMGRIVQVFVGGVVYDPAFLVGGLPPQSAVGPVTVGLARFDNTAGAAGLPFVFEGETTRTVEQGWEQSAMSQFSDTVSVGASFFGFSAKNSSTWTTSNTKTTSSSVSTEVGYSWQVTGTVPVKATVFCEAVQQTGQLDLKYNSYVLVIFDAGFQQPDGSWVPKCYYFTQAGVLRSVQYSSADVTATVLTASGELVPLAEYEQGATRTARG